MACLGSPISTIVVVSEKARRKTCHCTGSVSWNSSISTNFHRCCIRRARRGRGVLEGVGQLAEQVVVAEDPQSALAPLHLLEHVGREAHPHGGRRVGRARSSTARRLHHGAGVTDDGPRQLQGLGP